MTSAADNDSLIKSFESTIRKFPNCAEGYALYGQVGYASYNVYRIIQYLLYSFFFQFWASVVLKKCLFLEYPGNGPFIILKMSH